MYMITSPLATIKILSNHQACNALVEGLRNDAIKRKADKRPSANCINSAKISRLHKRYKSKEPLFTDVLEKDNSSSVSTGNMKILVYITNP